MLMVHRYLAAAFRDCGRIELRRLTDGRAESRVFSAPKASFGSAVDRETHPPDDDRPYAEAARSLLDAASGPGNWYITLNRPAPEAVAPFHDADMVRIMRLPLDFDPPHMVGMNSTDEERSLAERAAVDTESLLRGFDWPEPARAMSGNGHHLIYRCSFPNDDGVRQMLQWLYRGLHDRCSMCDPTVRNPSRILRLYGTLNAKGPDTPERPRRIATVWVPDHWDVVQPGALRRAALALRPAPPPRRETARMEHVGDTDFRTLDAVAWFKAHHLYRGRIGEGKHAVICPWNAQHSTEGFTSTVLWESSYSGCPTFHCSHAHCEGRTLRDVAGLLGDAQQFCHETARE